MHITPTATETARKYLVETAYHRPAGCQSGMWWERILGLGMLKPTAVILLDMRKGGCQKRRLLHTIGKWPAISGRRAGVAQYYPSKLTGNSHKETIDTGATASFVSEEMADNLAALGRIKRTRWQARLADGRCGGINAQLEVAVKFGIKQVSMSLLILHGVVDPLVWGWIFLTQVVTEIRCAGHEIIIPARNRQNGWLEENLSVALLKQASELNDTAAFLETELEDFNTMTVTSNMAEQQIKMKDDKPIKQRFSKWGS